MSNLSLNSNVGIIIPSSFEMGLIDMKLFDQRPVIFKESGMGKVNVALEVADMSEYCNKIILGGFAGGLRGLSVGEVVTASLVIDGDLDVRPFDVYPKSGFCKLLNMTQVKEVPFISQDYFLTEDPYTDDPSLINLKPLATDMESYAFVKACFKFGVEPYIVKVISDVADKNAVHDFKKSCEQQATRMNIALEMMVCEAISKRRSS